MTRFMDGPAAGVVLMLRRAPLFLRAVWGPAGDWDALDQLDDRPRSDEAITVYELRGQPTNVHVNRGRHGSGWYVGGAYYVVEPQPADAEVRDTANWRTWTTAAAAQRGHKKVDQTTGAMD